MIRITCGTTILTLAIFLAGCGGKPPRAHYEKAGGFSYDPPQGWQIITFPGLKYRISHGPTQNGFAPNINVIDEPFRGTLAEYVDLNLVTMKKMFVDARLLKRDDFQTEDDHPATRVVFEDNQ